MIGENWSNNTNWKSCTRIRVTARIQSWLIWQTISGERTENFWVGYSHQTRKLTQSRQRNDGQHHIFFPISSRKRRKSTTIMTLNFMLLMTLLYGKNALWLCDHLVKFEKWSPKINAVRECVSACVFYYSMASIFGPPQRVHITCENEIIVQTNLLIAGEEIFSDQRKMREKRKKDKCGHFVGMKSVSVIFHKRTKTVSESVKRFFSQNARAATTHTLAMLAIYINNILIWGCIVAEFVFHFRNNSIVIKLLNESRFICYVYFASLHSLFWRWSPQKSTWSADMWCDVLCRSIE